MNLIKKWLITVLVLILVVLCMNLISNAYQARKSSPLKSPVIIIDAGHGGFDPGKVGVNDALEKDINLNIAIKLKTNLEASGYQVIMTRSEDIALYPDNVSNKKRADLKARVQIANDSNAQLVISIHQNSFPQSNCKGAQVFYYKGSEEGKKLADCIQTALVEMVDPDNKRLTKENSDYYMLKEIKTTAVIVECGFLSNPNEANLLTQDDYQAKIADGICTGVLTYLKQ